MFGHKLLTLVVPPHLHAALSATQTLAEANKEE